MISADYMTFNGQSSKTILSLTDKKLELRVAELNGPSYGTNQILKRSLTTVKTPRQNKFLCLGSNIDTPPQLNISLICESALTLTQNQTVLNWLLGTGKFDALSFSNIVSASETDPWAGYTYRAIITSVDSIFAGGGCRGFSIVAELSSPFAEGAPTTDSSNASQIGNRLVYPTLSFVGPGTVTNNTTGTSLSYNGTGSAVIDCESHTVTGASQADVTGSWISMAPGENDIDITGNCAITCPNYKAM